MTGSESPDKVTGICGMHLFSIRLGSLLGLFWTASPPFFFCFFGFGVCGHRIVVMVEKWCLGEAVLKGWTLGRRSRSF